MPFTEIIAASADDSAYRFGQAIGFLVVFIGGLLGVFKCIRIMKRPTTHSLCVVSLMIFLICWMLATVLSMLSKEPQAQSLVLITLLRIVLFMMFLASLVIAIVGLCLYDKSRHNQGRAQAIWSICLVSLLLLIGVSKFVTASNKNRQALDALGSGSAMEQAAEFKEFNFSIQAPEGWIQVKPQALNPEACFAMRRTRPEIYGVVLAERLMIEKEQMVEVVKSNLELAAKIINQSQAEATINGVDFTRINSKAIPENMAIALEYEHWVAAEGGVVWQVAFWGNVSRRDLTEEARRVIESFRRLDPDGNPTAVSALESVERPVYGYRASLAGMGWHPWVDEEDGDNHALYDLRAERFHEVFMVMPLLFDCEPPPMHALRKGALSSLSMEDVAAETLRIRDWDPGKGGKGQEIVFDRDIEGTVLVYKVRIARFADSAYLIAGWITQQGGNMDLLTRAMDSVEWIPVEGEPPALAEQAVVDLAMLYNEIGIAFYEKDQLVKAAEWFEMSYNQHPDPVVLGNAGDALEKAEMASKGRQLLGKHAASHPNHHYVGLQYARLLALDGDVAGGKEQFMEMLGKGLDDPDDFLGWIQLLGDLEHYEVAIACADAWVERNPSRDARRWQAQTYSIAGNFEKALELHEALWREFPEDLKIACSLAEMYNEADQWQKARTLAESILEQNSESVRALMALGWSQMGLKWYRDAKRTFEKAAQIDPDDEDIKYAVRSAAASLGQGDSMDVRQPIDPVVLPGAVKAEMEKLSSRRIEDDGHPCTWLSRCSVFQFVKGQQAKRTYRNKISIHTEEGAKSFSSVSCRFNPLYERIYLNNLRVLDADGKEIGKAGPDDVYVRDEDDGTASDYKVLHVQVGGAKPGVQIEWEVTIEDKGTADDFEFRRELFASGRPTMTEAVVVVGDTDKTRYRLAQGDGITMSSGKGWRAWVQGYRKANTGEAYSVMEERHHPMLWIGSSELEWEKIGGAYLDEIKAVFEPTESIAKLAEELTAKSGTDRQKVAAILGHIQKTVGYQAIEFGVRGTKPHTADKTLELRYGDCKDMAVLMVQLLRAAGVKSNPALVDTQWLVEPSVPSMDQFNHMVVHVPSLGEDWLVDPTEKYLDQSRFPATGFWSNRALILDADKVRLIELPESAPVAGCQLTSRRTIEIIDGGWLVDEVFELTGYTASWMRGAFVGMHPAEQRKKAQRVLAVQGNAQVLEFEFPDIEDVSKPARLKLKYKVLGGISEVAGHQLGVVPALWEKDYLFTKFMDERLTPYHIQYPYAFKSQVAVKLPAGSSPMDLEKWSRGKKSDHGSWSIKARKKDQVVEVELDFSSVPGVFAADAYRGFHDHWEQARIAWDKPLAWTVKADQSSDE